MSERSISVPRLSDVTVLMGLLEDGELSKDLAAEIKAAIVKTRDVAGHKQSGTCSVTLKLAFKVDGDSVEIKTDLSSVVPKEKRSSSMFFLTGDGDISTQHPKQYGMEFDEDDGRVKRMR